MNTTARMKGNRSSAGETLPGVPFDSAPQRNAIALTNFETPVPRPNRRFNWRRRSIILPSMALIAVAGLVMALFAALTGGASNAPTAPAGEDQSVLLVLPGTPTPVPEPTLAPTEPATAAPPSSTAGVATVAGSTTAPVPTAPATTAAPVRVRYEVLPGDSCDLLRQKFGFPAAELDGFATALSRISGRTPANQCAFRQGDVVCIPTAPDLQQLDKLTRDTGCLLNGTPAAAGS